MRYLLDVNTLIALGHVAHAHHQRAQLWQGGLTAGVDVLGTCAITELGFVRVSVQSGFAGERLHGAIRAGPSEDNRAGGLRALG